MNTLRDEHRVMIKFIVSYLCMLVIPICIGSFVYYESVRMVEEESRKANLVMLNQTMDMMDARLNEIQILGQQLALNEKNVRLLRTKQYKPGSPEMFSVWDFINDMTNYSLTNKFILDFFIFYRDSNLIVNSASAYVDEGHFHDHVFEGGGITAEQWQANLWEKYGNGEYIALHDLTIKNANRDVLAYVQSFPIGNSESTQSKILLMMDLDNIRSYLKGMDTGNGGLAVITDSSGRLIAGVDGGRPIDSKTFHAEALEGETFEDSEGREMIVTRTTSKYNHWHYITAVPASHIYAKVNYIEQVNRIVIGLAIVIGIIAAFILTLRTTKPIREIYHILVNKVEGDADRALLSRHNVKYEQLSGKVSDIVQRNSSLQTEMELQAPLLQATFLRKLLFGEFTTDSDLESFRTQVKLQWNGERFKVFVIWMQPLDSDNRSSEGALDMYRLLVKNTLNDHLGEAYYMCDLDQTTMAVVLMFREERTMESQLLGILHEFDELLPANYDLDAHIAIGNTVHQPMDISMSYEQARQALDYIGLKQHIRVMKYDELPSRGKLYDYPLDAELRLISAIKAGSAEEALRLLSAVYRENMGDLQLSADMFGQLFSVVKGTVLRGLNQSFLGGNVHHWSDLIVRASTFEELVEHTTEAVAFIAEKMEEQKTSTNQGLKDMLIACIREEYSNESLNLDHIASKFQMSNSYLYHFFREQIGSTFADYLEQVRLDAACRLLREGECSIKEVASRVGYNSDHSFRRAFKRALGVLPSQYVETMLS